MGHRTTGLVTSLTTCGMGAQDLLELAGKCHPFSAVFFPQSQAAGVLSSLLSSCWAYCWSFCILCCPYCTKVNMKPFESYFTRYHVTHKELATDRVVVIYFLHSKKKVSPGMMLFNERSFVFQLNQYKAVLISLCFLQKKPY